MLSPRYILALDQGTTSSRSIVFDSAGRSITKAQREFRQIYPQPGWVEHDPAEIWASQLATMSEVMSAVSAREIAAIGITNQRETTVIWDRATGQPVYNAIVWQDRRTADYCAQLKAQGLESSITAKTGLRLDPYFSATKIHWLLENIPGLRTRAEAGQLAFGTIDCWLLWNLTKGAVHATDSSNASRTLLFNLQLGDWDQELIDLFGIPRSLLPQIRSNSEIYGHVAASLPASGIPIAGMAGDQQAALFGQGCFSPGMAKNTYGTGCFLLMQTGTQPVFSAHNLLTTVAWNLGGKLEYALEGSVFIGGALIQWLRDEMRLVQSAQELDVCAASVPDAGGLFLVPAFAGLGAPHWDPYARGLAIGITRGTNRAHFCRAALDSIAFQSADLLSAMEQDSHIRLQELRVDGGASRSEPLMQFQADLLGTQVVRPQQPETTALGAAYLAGLAVGLWSNRDALLENWQLGKVFKPEKPAAEMAAIRIQWQRALDRSKAWEQSA